MVNVSFEALLSTVLQSDSKRLDNLQSDSKRVDEAVGISFEGLLSKPMRHNLTVNG